MPVQGRAPGNHVLTKLSGYLEPVDAEATALVEKKIVVLVQPGHYSSRLLIAIELQADPVAVRPDSAVYRVQPKYWPIDTART